MLLAYDHHKHLVFANHAVKDAEYTCPHCKSKMILKKGEIITPHFAHLKVAFIFCSKGETQAHYSLKYQLALKLSCIGYHVQIEPYIAGIYQYPDLIIDKKIAIEIQFSKITISSVKKRSNGLLHIGYRLIWIIPNPYYDKLRHILILTKYERTFIDFKSKRLLTWDSSNKQLYMYQIYNFIGGNRYIAHKFKLEIKDFEYVFSQIETEDFTRDIKLNKNTIQQYINRCRCTRSVKEPSLSVMYNLGLSDNWVSTYLGIIYPEQLYIQSHPIYWQLQLLYLLVKTPQNLNEFNEKIMLNHFYNIENTKDVIVNELINKFRNSYSKMEYNNVQN
ncbi:competence protein CoiA family protein [Staphylococcus saprophyticus]|nr:competence protein CoiA family protein [Staphylococcus saprophyticus]